MLPARSSAIAMVAALVLGAAALAEDLPPHPRDIKYGELKFEPPKPADHRVVLSNGLRVYLVPDRTVPALHVRAWLDTGEMVLPKDKRGLAKLAGGLLRTGGVEGIDARALDARLDALAAELEATIELESGRVALWTLSKHADEALRLFALCLTKPTFEPDRIRRAKDELREEIAHRDDEPQSQLDWKVRTIVLGDHPLAWRETVATVDGVTRENLVLFHKSYVVPKNVILAVAGDFEREAMVKRLEALFSGWKAEPEIGLVGPVDPTPRPGLFLLDRELNQGFVELVKLAPPLNHPDEVPLQVMNYILGGGSFTSRITKRVRNDEGLAYSAGSYVHFGRGRAGLMALYFQSKAPSTAFAAKICVDEARRIREETVSAEELQRAKDALRDRFPEKFSTAHGTAAALAEAEFNGRPLDWLETWRAKVAAVTAADVQRVAKEHLDPAALSAVVVGPAAVVLAKDEEKKAALEDLGPVQKLAPE